MAFDTEEDEPQFADTYEYLIYTPRFKASYALCSWKGRDDPKLKLNSHEYVSPCSGRSASMCKWFISSEFKAFSQSLNFAFVVLRVSLSIQILHTDVDLPLRVATYTPDLYDARLRGDLRVRDMIVNGQWRWPYEWNEKFPMLKNLVVPSIKNGVNDRIVWHDKFGKDVAFSVSVANRDMNYQDAEDLDHLMFKCEFASEVWNKISVIADMQINSTDMKVLIHHLSEAGNGNNIQSVIRKMAFAATVYGIWSERNGRVFKEEIRSCDVVVKCITDNMRNKLLGIKVKDSATVREVERIWNISCNKVMIGMPLGLLLYGSILLDMAWISCSFPLEICRGTCKELKAILNYIRWVSCLAGGHLSDAFAVGSNWWTIGLKVNVHKSSLYGVGVCPSDIRRMADHFGCLANNLPFIYLGIKVGANMKRVNSWSEVVNKVTNKLSSWKAKTLSARGRLTLIKSVLGAISTYYMSLFKVPEGILSHLEGLRNNFFLGADQDDRKITWVCWRKVMAHKNQGGLGVNSLYALNFALMFKWIWRFLSSSSSLWIKVVKVIHGNSGSLEHPTSSRFHNSTWIGIVKAINKLKSKGVDLMSFCKRVIGNGNNTRFWLDKWYGDVCFKEKFHRLFNLELLKDASLALKLQDPNVSLSFRRLPRSGIEDSQLTELLHLLSSVILSPTCDRWTWTLHGLGEFSVKTAREEIDKHVLVSSSSPTRWCKILPIKINIFVWRMLLDRLPTRINLTNRGLDIPSVLCPNCGVEAETRNHLFFSCSMALDLFRLLGRWWNIQIPSFVDSSTWEAWFNGVIFSSLQKQVFEACFFSMWWHIWTFRNSSLFSSKKLLKGMIFYNIVSHTSFWVNNRCRKFNINWVGWLNDPLNAIVM
ncbi:RNA-directed DNA polymerase, eukaryota, reverse transcriptase zinc-binding domain protein [Tanacetum coccineum]|uniref:RNA-directed DNA polymerase, eukaryota, reverse transcriptase zinc-binding domain protein n=1 Tax=Tanacetum coccineum TaxID=301880 RepID=A0ABQ5EN84_9ASTR